MIVLDIWAGGTSFWKELRALNPWIKAVYCWDLESTWRPKAIDWRDENYWVVQKLASRVRASISRLGKVLTPEEIENYIGDRVEWVFRVNARYEDLHMFPEECFDVITINSPHPYMPPRNPEFSDMICSRLKPWWIAYSSHTQKNMIVGIEKMEMVHQGAYKDSSLFGHYTLVLENKGELIIPKWRTLRSNLMIPWKYAPVFKTWINPWYAIHKKK